MQMKITKEQAAALIANRVNSTVQNGKRRYNGYGKGVKRRIFADIRRDHNLPASTKMVFFLDNENNPLHLVIRSKSSRLPLDDGRPTVVETVENTEEDFDFEAEFNELLLKALIDSKVKAAVKAAVKPAAKKAPAKAVAKKAPAKAPAKKAPAKKAAPVKAVAKKAPAKAVKAPAKAKKR